MSTGKPIPIKSMVSVVKSVDYYVLCLYYALDDVFTRTWHNTTRLKKHFRSIWRQVQDMNNIIVMVYVCSRALRVVEWVALIRFIFGMCLFQSTLSFAFLFRISNC